MLRRILCFGLTVPIILSIMGCSAPAAPSRENRTSGNNASFATELLDIPETDPLYPSAEETIKDIIGIPFGASLHIDEMENPATFALAKKEFNSITMGNEMKPESLLLQEDSKKDPRGEPCIDTKALGNILEIAKNNGLKMRGHCLVWYSQTPSWFFKQGYDDSKGFVDKDTMLKRMNIYIKKVITYCQENYPGVIYAWDVVNEAIDDKGGYRENENNWYTVVGSDYVEKAFEYARKYADKNVALIYNDYNLEVSPNQKYSPQKSKEVFDLVNTLHSKGLCDGIGFQSHWTLRYPSPEEEKAALLKFAEIPGLQIQYTEIDVRNTDNSREGNQKLAKHYGDMFKTILELKRSGQANITSITFWGLDDGNNWLTIYYKKDYYPLLFDAELNRKLCYNYIYKTISSLPMK